jgi:hypothetical protein
MSKQLAIASFDLAKLSLQTLGVGARLKVNS